MGVQWLDIGLWMTALAALGGVAGYGQRWALEVSGRWPLLAAWLAATTVGASALIAIGGHEGPLLTITVWPDRILTADWMAVWLQVLILSYFTASVAAAGCGFWDRLFSQGILDACRAVARLLVPVVLSGAAFAMIAISADKLDSTHRFTLTTAESSLPAWLILIVCTLMALNASGWARALACRRLERIAGSMLAIVPTALMSVICFVILRHALDGLGSRSDLAMIVRTFPGGDQDHGAYQRFADWLAIYATILFSLAISGAIGIRLGPKPWNKVKRLTPWKWSELGVIRWLLRKHKPARTRVKVRLDQYATTGGIIPEEAMDAAQADPAISAEPDPPADHTPDSPKQTPDKPQPDQSAKPSK